MGAVEKERENLRGDIVILRRLLDDARNRQPPDNLTIHACNELLRDRYGQLDELQRRSGHEDAA